jgi:hypothetical protein
MHVFSLETEQQWDPRHHVEKILGKVADGDFTVACWEPGQISPYHCARNRNLLLLLRRGHHADTD